MATVAKPKSISKKAVVSQTKEEVNVIDLVLIDHLYLKSCIKILKDEEETGRKKLSTAKGFLDALDKHSKAEQTALYTPLKTNEEIRPNILEGEVEHGIADQKVKLLKAKVARGPMNEHLEAELKVLAEVVQHHIKEEESELLPKIKSEIDEKQLLSLGAKFLKLRKFRREDLQKSPQLQTELLGWKTSMQELSKKFVSKMDKYIGSMRT